MKLLNIQKKFINEKPIEHSILKGKCNTGKSETLIHRALNLINNFAYEEEDKILFIQKEKGLKEKIIKRYLEVKEKNNYIYMSLLSSDKEVEFLTLNELIAKYSKRVKVQSLKEKNEIIKDILKENDFVKCKNLNKDNTLIILNEIKYMKNHNIRTEEEFMTLMGGPLRLRKNSASRKDMFKLFTIYNKILKEKEIIDEEDRIRIAINNIREMNNQEYVHIFIDNAEDLSKLELEFVLALYKKKPYGSITIVINIDRGENIYSSLVKKGKVYAKRVFGNNKKIFNFKVNLENSDLLEAHNYEYNNRDKYKFIDIKHKRNFEFTIEHSGNEEIILDEHEKRFLESELKQVPVFNNIAAGEPILITPEQEDSFLLPKYWVRGENKKFILKVKGNSMINADINDGDLVLIEQTQAPSNGDIVAVNIGGNATLKTLKIGKTQITLMPENDMYDPIIVSKDEEFFILGKALGVIRK